jgi:hypothetical protein
MQSNWSIQVHKGQTGLRGLQDPWERLLAEMPQAGFEHAFETHSAYFRHISTHPQSLQVLALSDGTRIRALCPLETVCETVLLGRAAVWGLAPSHHVGIFLDWLCPDAEARAVLLPLLRRHLQGSGGPAWLVHDRVLEGSTIAACLQALPPQLYRLQPNGARDVLDTRRGAAALIAQLSAKHRSNLSRGRKHLAQSGSVSMQRADQPADLAAAFETFVEVEARGWKGAEGQRGGLRYHDDQRAFYRELVATWGAQGRCEIHTLRLDAQCIAGLIAFRTGSEWTLAKTCYDEAHAKGSGGKLLTQALLDRCCEDPAIDRLNLVSHNEWLKPWQPRCEPAQRLDLSLHRRAGALRTRLLDLRRQQGPRLKHWLGGKPLPPA